MCAVAACLHACVPEHPLRLLVIGGLGLLLLGCQGPSDGAEEAASANVVLEAEVERRVEAARQRLTQSEGGKRILRAIEAHGGLAAWYRAPTSSYQWTFANKDVDFEFSSFLVVDNRTRRAYHDLIEVGPYGDPAPVEGRFAWDGERAWIVPDSLKEPNPRFWALAGFYVQQIPFVLADPGVNYEALPDDTFDGTPHDMVRITFDRDVGDTPADTYTLYLNKNAGRVEAMRHTISFGRDVPLGADLRETLYTYEDYVTVHGLTVPTQFTGYAYADEADRADTLSKRASADSISYRRPFNETRLTPPDNARFVPLPEANMESV